MREHLWSYNATPLPVFDESSCNSLLAFYDSSRVALCIDITKYTHVHFVK